MSRALKAAPYATGALASLLSTGAFFTYHAKRNTYVNAALYGVPSDGVERENYNVQGKQSAFRPLLSTLSFLYGYCVDTVYALCAGYGRGKLHFETGHFGPLRETAAVARKLHQKRDDCFDMAGTTSLINWLGPPDIEWDSEWKLNEWNNWQRDGKFLTPLYNIFPRTLIDKILNEESKYCYVRYIRPNIRGHEPGNSVSPLDVAREANASNHSRVQGNVSSKAHVKQIPLCLHLPCSGDQTFKWRSKHFANPLASKDNIASLIIICPFYGQRQTPNRPVRGAQVDRVSDLFTIGACLIAESVSLLSYCKKNIPEHKDGMYGRSVSLTAS